QVEKGDPQPLPSLPVEVWLIILQMALRPSIVVDAEFEPFEIDLVRTYLDRTSRRSERAAQEIVSRNKRALRAVCRSWKKLVDTIEAMWAWDVTCCEDAPPVITDPYRCPRLNQYHQLPLGAQINGGYTYPVSTLMMEINFHDYHHLGPIHMTSLKEVVSFPNHLRVLILQLECCKASGDVLRDIEVMRIPLTTLGLRIDSIDIFQTSLEIPTLISLFVMTPEYNTRNWRE
ncbi:16473_t:CDS:1, partial [Acaulospora colombiana]